MGIKKIKKLDFMSRVIKIYVTSFFEMLEKIFFSGDENRFIRNKRNRFKMIIIRNSTRRDDEMNMRVSIEFSPKRVDNGKDSRLTFKLFFKKIVNRLRSSFRHNRKSGTMSFEKRT